MAAKPKARKAPSKGNAAEKQKEQSARFIRAAREHGVDESGKGFETAMAAIMPSKRLPRKLPEK